MENPNLLKGLRALVEREYILMFCRMLAYSLQGLVFLVLLCSWMCSDLVSSPLKGFAAGFGSEICRFSDPGVSAAWRAAKVRTLLRSLLKAFHLEIISCCMLENYSA